MLTKIPQINYEKCYPKRLKRIFQSNINYKTYDKFIPKMERAVVGNIPPEIINLFEGNKGQKIKEFQEGLVNLTKYLKKCYSEAQDKSLIFNDFRDLDAEDLKILEKSMSKYSKKCFEGILPPNITPEIQYTSRGVWKNIFKLSLKNEKGEKVMHDKALAVYKKQICPYPKIAIQQNNFAEANFWTYLKFSAGHSLDKTQFTKHYISDLKNCYTITEFIDQDIPRTTAYLNFEKLFGLKYMDPSNEPINSKLYDAGGYLKTSNFKNDKIVLRYFKKLWYRNSDKELNQVITDLENKINNPKTPHRNKIQEALYLFKKIKNKYTN